MRECQATGSDQSTEVGWCSLILRGLMVPRLSPLDLTVYVGFTGRNSVMCVVEVLYTGRTNPVLSEVPGNEDRLE